MTWKYVSDSSGWEDVLMGLQPLMDGLAEDVAATVRGSLPPGDGDVVAESYDFRPKGRTSDRAASSVAVRRADARALQARSGMLTRAAAAAGLEVRADEA